MVKTFKPPLFNKDSQTEWKDYLNKEGYVVIENILTESEKTASFNLFKKDWTTVSPGFDFNDYNTWSIKTAPMMFGKGMAVFNGFGQSDFMWNLRVNPEIQRIYKTVYGAEDLGVSFDGFSVFISNQQKSKPWLHIDENPKNTLYSIQGSYNFMSVGEDDAGFYVVPKSHTSSSPTEVKHSRDWIICDDKKYQDDAVKLIIPGNCFTLWNSRLIHSNVGMTKKKVGLNRLTAYITYLPKITQTVSVIKNRIEAYKNSKTTSHWVNKCELKRYPYGFGKTYEGRGYNNIKACLEDGEIPMERLLLI